jgi:hypothetical protein
MFHGLDGVEVSLPGLQPRDHADHRLAGLQTQLAAKRIHPLWTHSFVLCQLERVPYDRKFPGRDVVVGAEVIPRHLGAGDDVVRQPIRKTIDQLLLPTPVVAGPRRVLDGGEPSWYAGENRRGLAEEVPVRQREVQHADTVTPENTGHLPEVDQVRATAVAQVVHRRAQALEIVNQGRPLPLDDHENVRNAAREQLLRKPFPLQRAVDVR